MITFAHNGAAVNYLYVPGSKSHPARANLALMGWVFEQLRLPVGAVVLDPFCGVGTTGMAAAYRKLGFVGIELYPRWAMLARANLANLFVWWGRTYPTRITCADTMRWLQVSAAIGVKVGAVVTSPPYGASPLRQMITNGANLDKFSRARLSTLPRGYTDGYGDGVMNTLDLSRGGYQMYKRRMAEVYRCCAVVAGQVVVILKDYMENKRRIPVVADAITACEAAGLKLISRVDWQQPGSGTRNVNKAMGRATVDDEAVLFFRRSDRGGRE